MTDQAPRGWASAVGLAAATVASLVFFAWPLGVWWSVRGLETPKYKVKKVLGTAKRAFYDRAPAFEIREYPSYVVAEATVRADKMKEATSRGFRQVADYIFGNNMGTPQASARGLEEDERVLSGLKMAGGAGAKIAMTSPVMIETSQEVLAGKKVLGGEGEKIAMTSPVSIAGDDGKYTISFVMPSKYTLETLPKARNPNVEFREVPPQTLAVYSIRGGPYPTDAIMAQRSQAIAKALEGSGFAVKPNSKASIYGYYPPFSPRWQNLWELLVPVVPSGETGGEAKKTA